MKISRDRVYWSVIGVIAASIVWVSVGNIVWSGDSQQTNVFEAVPSQASSSESGPQPTKPADEMGHSGESSHASVTPSQGPASDPGPVGTGTVGIDRLSVCREVHHAQQQLLRDAAAAMEQWEVHVGAMNQLVVGAITLGQANQFWDQTRVGAQERLRAFASSDEGYQQRTYRCPPPAGRPQSDVQLKACQRGVAARHHVLLLARVALVTWRQHVHHMEMLRDGEMTPARATELWLRSWKDGQRQIDSYRSAGGAARGARC